MEQMTQELSIENYDLKSVKKLYNDSTGENTFLNSYTMLDIDEAKKKTYLYLLKRYNYQNPEYIQGFIESSALILARDLFKSHTNDLNVSPSVPGPVTQDSIATQVYENHRIVNIDSSYRGNLFSSNNVYDSYASSDMVITLNDVLDSTTTLELASVSIPFTFYNINADHGNNYFYVKNISSESVTKVEISADVIDAFRAKAADPIRDTWIADMEAQGLPGQELYDLVVSTLAEAKAAN